MEKNTIIEICLSERDFDYEIQALVNSFFPGQKSCVTIGAFADRQSVEDSGIWIGLSMEQKKICVSMQTAYGREEREIAVSGRDFHKREGKLAHPYRTEYKNKLKKLLFEVLRDWEPDRLPKGVIKRTPDWGTMTGVRPTKIPMEALLQGTSRAEMKNRLLQEYLCSEEKAEMSLEIAQREAKLLQQADYSDGYSLYIGIPFCPTTCLYCSFTSYPMERYGKLVPKYLQALKRELEQCASLELIKGRRLTCVYIGGGTPTTLSAGQLRELLDTVRNCYPVYQAVEFTVEAGRPDSITGEKLEVLRSAGAERISINPQTMQQKTLDLIGRKHTVEQVNQIFQTARELGFSNINMDLITGLPGESEKEFADTLCRIGTLDPDSITIHSLVIKRASRLRSIMEECSRQEQEAFGLNEWDIEVERAVKMEHMLEMGSRFAAEHGYFPYYMYRQKNSAGHGGSSQENIGYARPGKECLYNILMMEEKQTILAMGAGASTKIYNTSDNLISRVENVKSITDYISRVDEMTERKRAVRI